MSKTVKPPENVGIVPVNSGLSSNGKAYGGAVAGGKFIPNASAQLVREQDPAGAIVVHAVRRSAYVHERLHNLSGPHKLGDELYDAAEKFRVDFERAQLAGNFARLDLFSSRSGKVDMSDNLALAKGRIAKVFQSLGNGGQEPSLSQSCVWNVVGLGITLEDWTQIVRDGGKGMNSDKASVSSTFP